MKVPGPAIAAALALLTACGSTSDHARPIGATTTLVVADVAEQPAPAATSDGATDETSVAPAGAPAGGDEPLPIRSETLLKAGARYRTQKFGPSVIDVSFEAPASDAFADEVSGLMFVSSDQAGVFSLVTVVETSLVTVFSDPRSGPGPTSDVPSDALAWLAGQPWAAVGLISETRVAGYPARRATYRVAAEVDGAASCAPEVDRGCLWTFTNEVAGVADTLLEGESGTMYEVDVEGQTVLVVARDDPASEPLVQSLQMNPVAGTFAESDKPLLGQKTLVAGETYFWSGSSLGTYRIAGADGLGVGLTVTAEQPWMHLRGLASPDPCLSISDTTSSYWFGGPMVGTRADEPVTSDVIGLIDAMSELEVVSTPAPGAFGGRDVTILDVKPTLDSGPVLLDGGTMPLGPQRTYRIVIVPREGNASPDLITIELGSVCEPLLDGIQISVPA